VKERKEKKMKWFLTFSTLHPLRGCWIEIEAPTYSAARKLAFDFFERKWNGLYGEMVFVKDAFPGGRVGEVLR
jgi:hypothetical protein